MIGLYIVDGLLIAGIIYLCSSPFKTYDSIEESNNINSNDSNYLFFNKKKEVIDIV